MKRRAFLAALGCAAAWPLGARAQPGPRRVSVLVFGAAPSRDFELIAELQNLGYREGRDVAYTIRGADGDIERLPRLAREVVAAAPQVIVGSTSPVAFALMETTRDTPIVMMVVGDPVALELTDRLSRPSRNITGFTVSSSSIAAKRLELLRELLPTVHKVAYLWVPANPNSVHFGAQVRVAAEQLGIELVSLPIKAGTDIAAAFETAEKERVQAVVIESDPVTVHYSGNIADECLVRNWPAVHAWPFEVQLGALIAYGPAAAENFKGTASYVDRLLRGARIADLPFQEPTQIRLAINLRTARSLGLTVPATLLARADEVIE